MPRDVTNDSHPKFRIALSGTRIIPAGEYELEWRRFPMPPHQNLLLLHDLEPVGGPLRLTINLAGVDVNSKYCCVRNESECEGVLDMLTTAGIVKFYSNTRSGLPICRILRWE